MTRGLLLLALCVTVATGLGWVACKALHLTPHPREMVLAILIVLIATAFGLAPMRWLAEAPQSVASMAALLSTAMHLIVCLVLGGIIAVSKVVSSQALLLWMLPMYWATLVPVTVMVVRIVHLAPPDVANEGKGK